MLAVAAAGLMARHDANRSLQLANVLVMLHIVLLDVLHALREAEHLIAEAERR